MTGNKTNTKYPKAKIIDMYGFMKGAGINKKKKKRRKNEWQFCEFRDKSVTLLKINGGIANMGKVLIVKY